jgi:hypothetical protein
MRNKLLLVLLVASALISSLAWADPSPGTRITTGNWQQYKDSMPLGMQELFAGKYAWKMPSDAVMEVTAPVPIHLPAKYFQDTEKYSGQVKMAAVDGGGFVLKDYVAGMPFPKPSGPERGEQILFDAWYRYQPWVMTGRVGNAEIDSYGNITNTVVGEINFKFRHISDVGLPPFYPGADDMFTVANLEVLQPEQSKYTTNLVIVPDNLTEDQQNYVFLPSLRRSLRLSTAARCSPLVGGDYTPDDINLLNIQIPEFTAKSLGDRKILMVMHSARPFINSTADSEFTRIAYPPLMWPRPQYAKWELRDAYVIDIRPVPSYANGYCYSRRVLYIDKDTLAPGWVDLYDKNGKLWKTGPEVNYPLAVPGANGEQLALPAGAWSELWDLQNVHSSISVPMEPAKFTEDVAAKYKSIERYATPAGLDQVMQ